MDSKGNKKTRRSFLFEISPVTNEACDALDQETEGKPVDNTRRKVQGFADHAQSYGYIRYKPPNSMYQKWQ